MSEPQAFDSSTATVAIVDKLAVNGFRLVDRSEFDSEIHKVYKEPAPKPSEEKPPAS